MHVVVLYPCISVQSVDFDTLSVRFSTFIVRWTCIIYFVVLEYSVVRVPVEHTNREVRVKCTSVNCIVFYKNIFTTIDKNAVTIDVMDYVVCDINIFTWFPFAKTIVSKKTPIIAFHIYSCCPWRTEVKSGTTKVVHRTVCYGNIVNRCWNTICSIVWIR